MAQASLSFSPASSTIEQVDFDGDTDTLTITFNGGRLYDYFNVPRSVVAAMQAAGSAGQFFARQIKGRYAYEER